MSQVELSKQKLDICQVIDKLTALRNDIDSEIRILSRATDEIDKGEDMSHSGSMLAVETRKMMRKYSHYLD